MSEKTSFNIEALAKALEPGAFRPQPEWHRRHEIAVRRAKSLISSSDRSDHLIAAMAIALAKSK